MLSGIFIMKYIILLLLPALCATQSVKITPQVEIYNLDVTQPNAGVTFSCSAEDGKTVAEAHLDWYDENTQRISRSYEGDGDTMHMFTVERGDTSLQMKIPVPDINNDNGRYTCRGTLDGRVVEASIALLLYKGIQLVSPTTQYPLLGHDEKINCTVTASLKPETSWAFHNWKPVTGDRYIMVSDYLTIRNLTEADDGTYHCSVTLSNGDSKDYPIKVIGSKVPVMTAPVTSLPPTPKAGDTVELTCQATGRPAPVYNFYKVEGNNDIPVNPEAVTNGKLTLKDITQDTEGQYKCVASNVKGSVSVVFYVDVMIPPAIDPIVAISGSEGSEGRLSCSAVGDPQPSVIWKREGQSSYYVEQPTGDGRISVQIEKTQEGEKNERKRTIATLFFQTLQPDDMSNYVCEASNIVGTDEETAHVEVKYKPNFSSQDQTVFYGWVGGNTNLTCKANGNPEPVIRWMYQESELQSTGNYIIQTGISPVLTRAISYLIPTVKLDNVDTIFGTYTCRAENRHGQADAELQFEKAVLPDAPQLVVVDRKSTMLEVAVKPPARNGGQPVKQYSVKYGPPTASDPEYKTMTVEINAGDPSNTRVQLRNLEAKTEYRIKIAAITNVGTGVAADIIDSTLEVSVPGRVEVTSDKTGIDGNRYTLSWTTPLTGGADITDFEIKYAKVDDVTTAGGTWVVSRTPTDYKTVNADGSVTFYVLENLEKNSYYHVTITAINRIGRSEAAEFIFKTSIGGESIVQEEAEEEYDETESDSEGPVITGPESGTEEGHEAKVEGKMTLKGDTGGPAIGTGGIIAIIVVLLLVLVVVVDVAFCVTKQCGLFWTIRQAVGSKEPGPGASGKSPEEGDDAAAKLLGKEKEDSLRNENEVAKETEHAEEAGHEAEEKKELEPEDKEEKPAELPTENVVSKGEKTPVEPEAPRSEPVPEGLPAVETKPEAGDKGEATASA